MKRIMTKEAYDSGKITKVKQDGSREFISLLASIYADGTKIPPALIYKGASGDLQDTWLDDLEEKEHAWFTSSANRWSSNALGLAYLTQVFDPATRAKAGRGRRLLIVDGHSRSFRSFLCDGKLPDPLHTSHSRSRAVVSIYGNS